MTWVDPIVLGVMALSGLLACMRGLVREVLGIGAWIGAFAIASIGLPQGKDIVAQWIHDPVISATAAFVAILLVALVVLKLVAHYASKAVSGVGLGGLDRTLGLLFGLARGAVLVVAIYLLAGWLTNPEQWPREVQEAYSRPFVCQGAHIAVEYLPADKDEKGFYKYRPDVTKDDCRPRMSAADLNQIPPQGRPTGR